MATSSFSLTNPRDFRTIVLLAMIRKPKFLPFIFILISGCFTHLYPQSQQIQFERISGDQGLLTGTINCIIQDKSGFLWLGSTTGLLRYDGYIFKAYKHDPADSHSISGNHIWSLCEDRSGDLWIGTSGRGLNRYLRSEDRFVRYKHHPEESTSLAGDDEVPWIYRDGGGDIWVALWEAGLDLYKPETSGFRHYPMKFRDVSGVPKGSVHRIYEDRMGMLWIGTKRGLIRFDRRRNATKIYQHDPGNPQSLGGDYVYAITEDRQGNLWVGCSGGGLSRYVRQQDAFLVYRHDPKDPASLSSDAVTAICVDSSGTLWVGTDDGGLNRFDPATQKFGRYRIHTGAQDEFGSSSITSLYVDKTGILWIGTVGGGLNRLAPHKRKFAHFRKQAGDPLSLSAPIVDALMEDRDGALWVGTAGGGLNRFDFEKNEVEYYLHEPNNTKSLSANFVSALVEDKHGDLWVGVYGGGLNRFNYTSKTFTRYLHEPDNQESLSDNSITSLLEDRQGRLWIGTDGQGLNLFDHENETFLQYEPDSSVSPNWNHIFAIFEDRRGDLWVATWGEGVIKFKPSTGHFIKYKHDPDDPSSLSGNNVIAITEDADGNLWFGAWGEGLNRLNSATNKFKRYTSADGLPGETVYGILADGQGHLWISTNNGLARFHLATELWKTYDTSDGLQSTEFRRGAYHKGQSGRFYFGGVNGFNAFYPEQIKDNPHIPPVILTSFKILGQEIAPQKIGGTIEELSEMTLSYKDNHFLFEITALDYTNPQKNQYAYKMEGFNENWIYAGDRRYVSYTNLDAGEYTFRVKGSNNDGIWNEEGTSLKIIITPPPWKTRWAYSIYTLLAAAILLGLRRYEQNKARGKARLREAQLRAEAAESQARALEAEKEIEKQHIRHRIASDLHDEIGSNLSSIALTSELLEKRSEVNEELRSYLADIRRAARTSTSAIRDIIWFINPMSDQLSELITRMKETASEMLISVEYDFENPKRWPSEKLNPEVKRNVYLIYKEVLHNMLKHSQATHVQIRVDSDESIFTLSIKDNGVGFDEAAVRPGNGLRNLRSRAEQISGNLDLQSTPGNGTQIRLEVKIA